MTSNSSLFLGTYINPHGLPTQLPKLIRTDFWFNNGNIVVIAQNAAFKVHKGQLARHFKEICSLYLRRPLLAVKPGKGDRDMEKERERDDLSYGRPFIVCRILRATCFISLVPLLMGCVSFDFRLATFTDNSHPPHCIPDPFSLS